MDQRNYGIRRPESVCSHLTMVLIISLTAVFSNVLKLDVCLLLDKENEALRCAFLDAQNTRICTCGSDGNAVIWSADASDTASVISEKPSYTKTLTLPHGDSQIYACETIACMPMEHVMTASENQLHLWDISGGRDTVPLRTLDFEVKAALTSSGIFWALIYDIMHAQPHNLVLQAYQSIVSL